MVAALTCALRGAVRSSVSASVVSRSLSTSAVANKDFVQELYLRELKSYKAPAKAADAHVGQVRDFHAPSAPKAPVAPASAELSSQLDAYAKEEPEFAPAPSKAASSSEGALTEGDANAFLKEAAAPVPKDNHH
ncbi:hypothetical protein OC834_001042 [Tilletia horrida]|uniref:ATP synthase subunit H, mitochondrial n=1 Tax=Tilletia horrida TaxID=155126 RepID=A0AAN6GBG4_9BASI|nr:hypothetical protein OC842_005851 [Tilletia horrida]KAK0524656.1 hypothetical protein OC835_005855 [Tilletia horrida]KAK0536802.1 hypothetical protein OC834_001042 [Tilletia horrida]KAK0565561.1 hypothetical protein OC844_001150 [Tilletia horrida]